MAALTQQIAAWRASWQRLSQANNYARESFLREVGHRLGEDAPNAATQLGRRIVQGSDTQLQN